MNLVDLIIVVLLVSAVGRGVRVGMLRLLLSSGGFIGGLLLGSWVAKHLAVHFSGPFTKLIVIVVVELGLALVLASLGEMASIRWGERISRLRLGKLNQVLGAALEILLTLGIVWLLASAFTNVRSYNLGNNVRKSWIVQRLDSVLHQPPDVFAQLEKIISPNGFPNVFLGLEPRHTTVSPSNSVNNQAVINDEKSVVKVQGAGCGGIVDGSGFVVDKDIVITNAHVVAGIRRPEVVDRFGSYPATPIWFDANMDIAILRVNNLPEPALPLTDRTLADNEAAAVLGFPGGGPLVANNAVILDHVRAAGRNIYNQGIVLRNIYEVQTDVEPGNSGGPLLAADGSIAGVVFAKSVSQNNVGYALLIDQVKPIVQQAEQQNSPVATGRCAAD
jgi:S1-C subfamily serine protease